MFSKELESVPSDKFGDVKKCPRCGEPVEPMAVKCSACGYEFRGVEALKSSQQLADKLDEIAKSYRDKKGNSFQQHDDQIYSMREQARVIKSFPVPTTKEDLLDFAITMQSKWNSSTVLERSTGVKTAYKAKYEECVNKAQLLFPNDPMFQGVFEQHQAEKNMSTQKKVLVVCVLVLLFSLFMYILMK